MNKIEVVKDIINLARNFYRADNKLSMVDLFKQATSDNLLESIGMADIESCLRDCPECIAAWIKWSDNKRTNEGWTLKQLSLNQYRVAYFTSKMGLLKEEFYSDATQACVLFIKRELEEIASFI